MMTESSIKTMKLYSNVERVFNELKELGYTDDEPLRIGDLIPFDQYHYGGTAAVDAAIEQLRLDDTHHVLEVGSGIGGPARYLSHRSGCRVTALELQRDHHETAAELTARAGLAERVHHVCGDILSDQLPGNDYDAVVSWLAFLHIPNRALLFKRCIDCLKPSGFLYVEDLTKRGEFTQYESRDLTTKVYCEYLPTLDEYDWQLGAAGFVDRKLVDMSEPWKAFVLDRYERFTNAQSRHLRVHGSEIVAGLDDFFGTVAKLFAGANLGGVRILARKPISRSQ